MTVTRSFYLVLLLLFLGACASQPTFNAADNSALLDQAQQALDEQQYAQAARLLDQQRFDLLSQHDQQLHLIAQAKAGIGLRSSSRVLDALSGDNSPLLAGLGLEEQLQFSLWRSQAHEWQGQWSMAIGERIFVAPLLAFADAQANNDHIWFLIQRLPRSEINRLLAQDLAYDWLAWLRLSETRLNHMDNDAFARQLALWQAQFTSSSASNPLPSELQSFAQLLPSQPNIIGLLLPLSGPLESAGRSILAGFMAAYYQHDGQPSMRIVVKDTHDQDVVSLARESVNEGAELLVGPLERSQVEQLINSSITQPIIALNHSSSSRANLYQFALAPEQEVGILVRHQQQMGYRQGGTLLERADITRRQHQASATESQRVGIELIEIQELSQTRDNWLPEVRQFLRFDPRARDRARITREAAGASSSVSRSLSNSPIREDLEFMNLFATADGSTLIRPLLNLNFAERLPSYGTSQLLQSNQLRDLDQMYISVLPWQISPSPLRAELESKHGSLGRLEALFAMGVDAFDLIEPVSALRALDQLNLQGQTGRLTLNEQGFVQRELLLAQVLDGQLQLVDWPAAP